MFSELGSPPRLSIVCSQMELRKRHASWGLHIIYRVLVLASLAFVSSEHLTVLLIEVTGQRLIEINSELV